MGEAMVVTGQSLQYGVLVAVDFGPHKCVVSGEMVMVRGTVTQRNGGFSLARAGSHFS